MSRKRIDAYDVYRELKQAVPDGASLPDILSGITYLLADVFIYFNASAEQFENVFDEMKKEVVSCMRQHNKATKKAN